MRIQKVICDKCKEEIDTNPYKVCIEEADRNSGDFVTSYDKYTDLASYDFCAKCVENILTMIRNCCMPLPDPVKAVTKTADTKTVDSTEEEKTGNKGKKYDHDAIWELHKQGMRNIDIEKELGVPKATVAGVICTRRKKEAEPADSTKQEPVKEEKKEEKRSDELQKPVAQKTPSSKAGLPVKVCFKNCMECRFSSPGGYCDYLTLTGESRKDKAGLCTHRELRR